MSHDATSDKLANGLIARHVSAFPIHDERQIDDKLFRDAGLKPDGQNSMIWDPAMLLVTAYRAIGPGATAP